MSRLTSRQALAFMVMCLLLAAVLRLPDLTMAPPGLHYDEAANGTLAAGIGLRGQRPLFISSYTGKEPLFFYLAGGLMRLVGQSVFALRVTTAFLGLLTVAATYRLGWELFTDRRIGLIAATLIAVSFWHLLFSRLGFRAITQPLLQALTVAAFYRGVRRTNWRWLAAGGVFLGLTAYTYLAARLFPVLVLFALLPLLLARRKRSLRWKQLTLLVTVALVVAAPLLGYFANNPDAFWVRISQVAPGDQGDSLGQSYWKSLQMLFLSGDPYWRFNIPQRPLFDWFWGVLMVFGWLVLAFRWPRLRSAWRRSAVLLILLAPFLMILPTALATREIVPSNLRAIGLAPFVFYLPAAGVIALLQGWERLSHRSTAASVTLVLATLILANGGLVGYRTYFRTWASEPFVYYESDGDLAAVAQYLDETNPSDSPIYLAALHYRHPTIAFLSEKYDDIKWLPNSEALVFPADGGATVIYPRSSPAPQWAMPYLAVAASSAGTMGPDGRPAFSVYRFSQVPELSIPNQIEANFSQAITLLGYEIGRAAADETMPIMLFWRVNNIPPAEFTPFVHLEDGWRYRWSQVEPFAYPVAQWQPGETIVQRVELLVTPGTPPGIYRLKVGLFAPDTGERLALLDEQGRYAGDTFIIEGVTIPADQSREVSLEPPRRIGEEVRPGLHLLGYERGGSQVSTGERFPLALWWQGSSRQSPASIRLEMMREDNTGRILLNTQPVHDTYPFHRWQTPIFLIDRIDPEIPPNFPAGDHRLFLRLLDSDEETLSLIELGPLTVESTERLFTPPKLSHPLAATFGREIDLLGYDLTPAEDPRTYTLTLVWKARTQPSADYMVFVHLLEVDGVCCLWQQDVMPRQNQYPTSRWLENEVVVDSYQIELPEEITVGEHTIEVGLYVSETGRRLQVIQPGLKDSDVVHLQPLVIR